MAESDLPRTSLLTKYRDSIQELQETLIKENKWRQDAEGENRLLRKKNLEIEEQLRDFRYSAVEYMTKIEELSGENKRFAEKNKDIAENLQKIEDMYERQQVKADTLEKELDKIEESANDLKAELSDKQRIANDMKNSLIHLEEQLKVSENNNFQLKEEINVYKNAYQEIEYELQLKEKECKELYDNFKIIDEENNKFRQNEAWVLENQQILETKTHQLIEDERKLSMDYKSKLITANDTITNLEFENEKIQKVLDRLAEENLELHTNYANLKLNKAELERILNAKVIELEKNMIFAEDQFKSTLQQKEKIIQGSNIELNNLKETNESFQREILKIKDQTTASIQEINMLKSELHTKNEVICEITTKNKELSSQIQALAETIENEKIKYAKEVNQLSKKNEKNLSVDLNSLKAECEDEIIRKDLEIEEITKQYQESLLYIKEKEEDIININKDREQLQNMIRELDSKLRELLTKFHIDSENAEMIKSQYLEEKQSRILLENKYNLTAIRIKEIEAHYIDEIDKLNQSIKAHKEQIKEIKKKYQNQFEEKNKLAEDNICYWKEKFREEIGYLEKWAESIEGDSNSITTYTRICNIVKRLSEAVDYSYI